MSSFRATTIWLPRAARAIGMEERGGPGADGLLPALLVLLLQPPAVIVAAAAARREEGGGPGPSRRAPRGPAG